MKRIIAILLAVVLVAGGLGSFAYAQVNGHEPMTGQKLVGHGAYGVFPPEEDGTYLEVAGSFTVTNPDCVSEITIDRVSIFDMDGTVVYEGDLFTVDWEGGELVPTYCTEPLKPHEQRWIEVDSTMCYLRDQGYWEGDHIFFTVEIFWGWTDQKGLPLIGWAGTRVAKRAADGHIMEFQSGSQSPMVNMEQVLKPAPPPKVLKIGALAPITGAAAEKGKAMYHGEQDYFRYINDRGGIHGYPIDATFYDNAYSDEVAKECYQQAVEDGALLITAMSSKMTAACRCLFDADEMPFIHAYSSPQCLHPPGHGYAALIMNGDDCAAFMNWLHDTKQTPCSLALYGLDNLTGWGADDAAGALAESLDITVVGNWHHNMDVTSDEAKTALTEIQGANADWLYVSSTPAPSATIAKAARDLPMEAGICLGHAGTMPYFIDLAGASAEGVYGMQGVVFWGADVPGMDKAMEYCETHHPEDEGNPDYLAGWYLGMCAAEALGQALDHVKFEKLTPKKVEKKGVRNVSFDAGGLTAWVDWTDNYDRRGAKSVNLCVVKGGEWVVLEPWIEAPLIRYEDYDWFKPITCP